MFFLRILAISAISRMLPEQIWPDSRSPRAGLSRGDNQLAEEMQDTARNAPPAHRHFRNRALEKHDHSLEDVYLDAD